MGSNGLYLIEMALYTMAESRPWLNPLGSKGVGEGGTIPVPSVFIQALEDALVDYDLELLEAPLSPNRLYELLHA